MSVIHDLIKDAPIPRLIKVKQQYTTTDIEDVELVVRQELAKPEISSTLRPGMSIALTVGSRGVNKIDKIAAAIVREVKNRGAHPFVVPAMGSHGGATAEGQIEVLKSLGVTEETLGCPIRSSMEVVKLGQLDNGLSVYMDKNAYHADGIIVLNRVKPHTSFQGLSESGIVKMITIGLGKQIGAASCHAYGFGHMGKNILAMSAVSLANANIIFGVATVENPYDKVMKIVAVPANKIIETDQKLLVEAKANMPRIMFDPMDVLLVKQIGKEITGMGMDPNIIGRFTTPYISGGPNVSKLSVFDLTDKTEGNAAGIGLADFTTKRLVNRIDFDKMYPNSLTSTVSLPSKLPIFLDNELDVVLASIKTCNAKDLSKVRLVYIQDTLHIEEFWISEALLGEAESNPDITICGELQTMGFDETGRCLLEF